MGDCTWGKDCQSAWSVKGGRENEVVPRPQDGFISATLGEVREGSNDGCSQSEYDIHDLFDLVLTVRVQKEGVYIPVCLGVSYSDCKCSQR